MSWFGFFVIRYLLFLFLQLRGSRACQNPLQNPISFQVTAFKASEKELLVKLPDNQSIKVNILKKNNQIVIVNQDLSMGMGINDGTYLLLKSAKKSYLIYQKRNIQDFFKKGIAIQIPPQYLVPDTYQIGLFWISGDTKKLFNANQSVKINY